MPPLPEKPEKPAAPIKPVKPKPSKVAKPAKRKMDDLDTEVNTAFDELEQRYFGNTTPFAKDMTIVLLSPYGYFRVYQYDNPSNPKDKHTTIFFFNKKSKKGFQIHNTIARKYLDSLKKRDAIEDFLISDELVLKANNSDRISWLSKSVLVWNHSTTDVKSINYKDYQPLKDSTFIAYTQEYHPNMPVVNFKNWRGEKVTQYSVNRKLRENGKPTQILLHETATQFNMRISGVVKVDDYYPIPHFCINNVDEKNKGNIIQFVDIAERTPHGEFLNDRSVGVEFVNAPFEEFKDKKKTVKKFNLDKSTTGLYLKTLLGNYPELFIPLEYLVKDDKTGFELTVNKDDLINFDALDKVELGPLKEKILQEKSGIVTITNCKSEKFEHLCLLLNLLNDTNHISDIDLTKAEQYRFIHLKDDREFFLFDHAYVAEKKNDASLLHRHTETRPLQSWVNWVS